MNERISWIKHKGKEILAIDYSNLKSAEVVELLEDVEEFYESQVIPKGKKDGSIQVNCW